MSIAIILRRGASLLGMAALLAACASPAGIQPGESGSAVTARLGRPTLERPLPGGGQRLIYSSQPMGQYAWITDVGPDGKVIGTTQALTSERFRMLDSGHWDTDRLLFEFGPPAEITRVGLRGEQIVWGYRFREDGVWNSLMYVYVTDKGVVTRYHPGPDPLMEPRFQLGM
ncbi:hypothetical protein [Pigmentiphaga sp.]|uniref:hypothetical protein n=1 Tax=Pigmentiphaga sp. TaxID=1977564 RepID=UPI00128C8281|nr:hypothetical protein [Pigmentiphaga sp.]MPS29363.1 hypothetical protein [Alcaligenaceae bacterium SAGV5]MPS55391.1 hypothetical protein [Alcaligenaceae bacterium SAGV3]MPT56660.1 hypothetical protein [Alcaligenaceae bacterium]